MSLMVEFTQIIFPHFCSSVLNLSQIDLDKMRFTNTHTRNIVTRFNSIKVNIEKAMYGLVKASRTNQNTSPRPLFHAFCRKRRCRQLILDSARQGA